MQHKFEKLAQDGITLTEILQSRLDEIEAKINSDFPLISNLKDKNKNFLSTLYHIAQKSSTDDLAPEMIQFNIIGVVLERANIVGDEVSQEGLSGKELQNPDLIKEAISLSKFIEKDFGFEFHSMKSSRKTTSLLLLKMILKSFLTLWLELLNEQFNSTKILTALIWIR